jgi:hypothetical protein
LQQYRFRKAIPFLKGNVLDFGGNDGELQQYVSGSYTLVNYDYGPMPVLFHQLLNCLARKIILQQHRLILIQ